MKKRTVSDELAWTGPPKVCWTRRLQSVFRGFVLPRFVSTMFHPQLSLLSSKSVHNPATSLTKKPSRCLKFANLQSTSSNLDDKRCDLKVTCTRSLTRKVAASILHTNRNVKGERVGENRTACYGGDFFLMRMKTFRLFVFCFQVLVYCAKIANSTKRQRWSLEKFSSGNPCPKKLASGISKSLRGTNLAPSACNGSSKR